jgi:hypothetical protein
LGSVTHPDDSLPFALGLVCFNANQEAFMDFTQLTLAQTNSANQFRFDAAALERAILRRDKRRAAGRSALSQCRALLRQIWETATLATKMVAQRVFG